MLPYEGWVGQFLQFRAKKISRSNIVISNSSERKLTKFVNDVAELSPFNFL